MKKQKRHPKQSSSKKHLDNELLPQTNLEKRSSPDQSKPFPFIPEGYKPFIAPSFGGYKGFGESSEEELPF